MGVVPSELLVVHLVETRLLGICAILTIGLLVISGVTIALLAILTVLRECAIWLE